MLPVILCGCVLPIIAIWMVTRREMNETNARTQIVTAALEKNPDMDIEELLKKISPKKKLLKEKLLTKLLWGCLTGLGGLGFIGLGIWLGFVGGSDPDDITVAAFVGVVLLGIGIVLLGIGIAFLVNYGVGRKLLAKEIEAEENKTNTQA